ncbi:MAG: FecR domain-containing protein [Alphaproteobacteria bacterium]|nr:FecR domain-containing protein [Alphaproteobacteria bacterium]
MTWDRRYLLAGLAASALVLVRRGPAVAQGAAETAGQVEEIEGTAEAMRPGQQARRLAAGAPVYVGDVVRTGPDSSLGLKFLDDTEFDIGPQAELTIDAFVYQPARSVGDFAATVAVGAFRFVSGGVARLKDDAMRVVVPIGTIGVRGTHVAGEATREETSIALLDADDDRPTRIVLRNDAGSTVIDRPGFGTTLRSRRDRPRAAERFSDDRVRRIVDRGRFQRRLERFAQRRRRRLEELRQRGQPRRDGGREERLDRLLQRRQGGTGEQPLRAGESQPGQAQPSAAQQRREERRQQFKDEQQKRQERKEKQREAQDERQEKRRQRRDDAEERQQRSR